MRATKLAFVVLAVLLTPAAPVAAGDGVWTTGYAYGASLGSSALAIDPSNPARLYAHPRWRGLYRSADGGATWQPLLDERQAPFDDKDLAFVAVDPAGEVFVGSFDFTSGRRSLWRSADGGATWGLADPGVFGDVTVLAIAPSDPGERYLGTQNGRLYRSSDGGATWALAAAGGVLPAEPVRTLEIDPGDPLVAFLGTQASGVYKTIDGGFTWTNVNANVVMTEVVDVAIDPVNPQSVYAADNDPGTGKALFKSTNGGASWTKLAPVFEFGGATGRLIAVDPGDPAHLFAVAGNEALESPDGGASWAAALTTDSQLSSVQLHPTDPSVLLATSFSEGIFRSADGGATWQPRHTGVRGLNFPHGRAHSLLYDAPFPGGRVFAGSIHRGWRSGTGGDTWTPLAHPGAPQLHAFASAAGAPDTVYAFTGFSLSKSPDGGATWIDPSGGFFGCCFAEGDLVVDPANADVVYVAGYDGAVADGVYVSTDGGVTWNPTPSQPANPRIRILGIDPNDGNVLYAGTAFDGLAGGLFKTSDGGVNWTQLVTGLPAEFNPNQIVVHPLDSSRVYLGTETTNGGVYRSENGGLDWTKVLDDNVNAVAVDPGNTDRVYAGTWNATGFFRSLDGGTTWAAVNEGLPVRPGIEALAVDPTATSRVLAGTTAGVYEINLGAGSLELTVTTTGDSGPGSLRDAIAQANQDGLPNVIRFAPWLAVGTIDLASPLPALTEGGTTLDGDLDGDCVPDIEVNGMATCCDGISISSAGNLVRGLVINGFPGNGVVLDGGATGNVVECNFVGTDVFGMVSAGNAFGVHLRGGAAGNQIGGDPATQRNVISGNFGPGFHLLNAQANTIAGNLVGVAADGSTSLGNNGDGVFVSGGSLDNVVGPANVIAHNGGNGVWVEDGLDSQYPEFTGLTADFTGVFPVIDFADGCGYFESADAITPTDGSGAPFTESFGMRLTGTLTVDATGGYTFELPFHDDLARLVVDFAVVLDVSGGGPTPSATVGLTMGPHAFEVDFFEGGGAATLQLVITGPGTATLSTDGNAAGCAPGQIGLCGELFQLRIPSEGNRITGNSIFDNGGLGIAFNCCCGPTPNDPGDADVGPNTVLNYPELTGSTDLGGGSFTVEGTAPPDSTVEVFAAAPDPSGFGEGETLLATTVADGGGFFSATVTLPPGAFAVTATATDAAGNTSEFSPLLAVGVNVLAVDSTADSGPGSLRDAIDQANGDGAPTLIGFAPGIAGQTIALQSPLPPLTADATTVDGDLDGDCRPDVALDGAAAGGAGLQVWSSGNTLRGLALHGFSGPGVHLDGSGGPAANNVVECNHLGTDLGGLLALGNSPSGVAVTSGAGGNRVGPGNLVVANAFTGIELAASHGNQVVRNNVGLDAAGDPLPNPVGVGIGAGATGNVVGGAGADGNRIVATAGGIELADGGTSGNQVLGNAIGWPEGTVPPAIQAASGVAASRSSAPAATFGDSILDDLPIARHRERLLERWQARRSADEGASAAAREGVGDDAVPQGFGVRVTAGAAGNQIGDVAPGLGNEITNNGGTGVRLDGGDASDGNVVRGNSIYDNGALGIDLGGDGVTPNDAGDLDSGANEGMSFPVLTSAVTDGATTTVEGQLDTAAPAGATVDLYGNGAPDPSGFGEGETWLASVTPDPGGAFSLLVPAVPAGSWVTATATDAAGNTSELSGALQVQGPTAPASALMATAQSSSSALLTWQDPNAGETGLRVERSFDGNGWAAIDTVGPNATSYLDEGLAAATLVYYRVVAFSAAGDAVPSNVAAAVTHAASAAKVCRRELGDWRGGGRFSGSVAWNGSQWAAAWPERRDGRNGEIYFQMLSSDGTPAGAPLQITEDDMPSQLPTLRWNGSSFGLLYHAHARGPDGDVRLVEKFAELDAAGNLLHRDALVMAALNTTGSLNNNVENTLEWNGTDWGWFHNQIGAAPGDVQYVRVGEDGTVLAPAVALTSTPDAFESDVSAAWSGGEYGVAWIRERGFDSRVFFQRVQADGTLLGAPLELWQNASGLGAFYTDVIWDGAGWAVVWMDVAADGSQPIYLARLDAGGNLVSGPNRISDDFDPAFPPQDEVPVFDEIPDLFVKPGGGYVVFTSSFLVASGSYEIGRLEADAAGNRAGSRTILSAADGLTSVFNRAAADGASFLVTWQDPSQLTDVVVDAAGAVQAGPSALTVYQSPGEIGFQSTRVAALGEGFVALWIEDGRLFAEIYDGTGTLSAQHFPLSPTTGAGAPGLVGLGDTFAVAWKDDTNSVLFDRYDAVGNPLFGEVVVATPSGGGSTAVAFSGEVYGLAWARGGKVRFQKVAPDGALLGPQVAFGSNVQGPGPLLQWVGSGWAVVWRTGGNLFFARLDASGALAVLPTQLTFSGRARNDYDLLWSGELLGLAWSESIGVIGGDPDLLFTVLDREGVKAFPEKVVSAEPVFADSNPALTWAGDRFRLAFLPGSLTASGVREIEILPDGTVLPGSRLLDNHSGALDVASNGATSALLHQHLGGLHNVLFSTTECLNDVTPPDPPGLFGGFDGQTVSLGWGASTDPESTILGYNVYRDGELLAEEGPGILGFDDFGPAPDTLYRYDVRALNGAFLESPEDPVSTLFVATGAAADLEVVKGDAPDPVLAGNSLTYTLTVTNHGPDPATGVTLTDTLPAEVAFASSNPGSPACGEAAGVVTCGLGGLSSGQSATVTLEVTVDPAAAGTITNGAEVTSDQLDPVASNGSVSETTTVETALPGASALVATAQSSSAVHLTWHDPNGGELGLRLERSLDGASFAPFHSVGANVTTFTDSGRPAGTLHYYRVVAFDALGDAAPSNVAAAMTFPAAAATVCRQPVGRSPEWARNLSLAHDGTGWAAVWQERSGSIEDELYFRRLDADGAPTGIPVQLTDRAGASRFPKLEWNGSRFGLLWAEHMRTADGSAVGDLFFALLAADGTKLRGDVRVFSHDQSSFLSNALEPGAFLWDGSGWAIVSIEGIDPPSDLHFYRLDEDGDLLTGPVQLTSSPDGELDPSLAWNGADYGLAWIRQRDDDYRVLFQRMATDGTLLGSPTLIWDNPSNRGTFVTSTVWDGGAWAVAFYDVQADGSEAVYLARLDAAGNLLAAPQRISDDFDPAFPGDEVPVFDEVPQLVNKPGGGNLIFTSSFLEGSGAYEIGRLEADATGARVGSRVILSDDDGAHSIWNRVASDGTTYLVGYNDHRLGTQEVATVLVDAAGVVLAGPSDVTAGHDPGNSFFVQGPGAPATVPVGDGFAALWTDTSSGSPLLQAELFDGAGASVATRFPLSVRDIAAPPAVAALGDSFAVAWKDAATNDLLFDRYDAAGESLLGGEVTVTPTASHRGVGMAFSGEAFGLAWYDGNQRTFRRVAPDGTLLGSPAAVPGTGVGPAPQVQWVGSGWALVWRNNADRHLYYTLVDDEGAVLVPAVQVTFTSSSPNNHRLLWTGQHLGLAWQEIRDSDPPGSQVFFTVLGLDGFKAFPEVAVADGFGNPDLYWAGDRFRVVYRTNQPGGGGLREVGILPDGTLVPGSRLLSNHQGPNAVAHNGATAAVLYAHDEMFFETTACLEDATAPTALVLSTSFDGSAVQVAWTAADDPESGILTYLVYRDGSILAELSGTTLAFADGGFTPGTTHGYEVRSVNGAFLETPSAPSSIAPCALEQVVANQVVSGAAVFEACQTLTAGPALTVTATGELTLRAGLRVVLTDGFVVQPGGSLVVQVDPALDPQ
jgi:uncharacterized repeat protein (TIGR01451 family)